MPDAEVLHLTLDGESKEKIEGCEKLDSAGCRLPPVAGKVGGALSFDGKSYIDAGGPNVANFNYMDPLTLAAWINPSAPTGAILSRTDRDYFEAQGYGLYLLEGKIRFDFTMRWTDYSMRLETTTPVEMHRWQHVLLTYDGKRKASGVHIYLDGKPKEFKTHIGLHVFQDLQMS